MGAAATFVTVSDAGFFTGTVALLNSLRLTGHREELVVLDNGLSPSQRSRLEPHCTLVTVDEAARVSPLALKAYPIDRGSAGTVVVIDGDMIVTASLAPVLAVAEAGGICMFAEEQGCESRWFAEWQQLLGLRESPRREEYLNSGVVAFSTGHWPDLRERWWQLCARIPPGVVFRDHDHPLCYGDQDALNALLTSEIPPGSVTKPAGIEMVYSGDSFEGVAVTDPKRLVCLRDGRVVAILHHDQRPKVWSRAGRRRVRPVDAYVRLLPRVLFGDDVTLRLEPADVPWWLRPRLAPVAVGAVRASERVRGRIAIRTRVANRGRLRA